MSLLTFLTLLIATSTMSASIVGDIAKVLQDHEKRIAKLEKSVGFPASARLYYGDCEQIVTGNWSSSNLRVISEHGDKKDGSIYVEAAKQGDCEKQIKILRDHTSVLRQKLGEIVVCSNRSSTRTLLRKYAISTKPDVIDTGSSKEFSSDADCLAGMKTYYDNLKW